MTATENCEGMRSHDGRRHISCTRLCIGWLQIPQNFWFLSIFSNYIRNSMDYTTYFNFLAFQLNGLEHEVDSYCVAMALDVDAMFESLHYACLAHSCVPYQHHLHTWDEEQKTQVDQLIRLNQDGIYAQLITTTTKNIKNNKNKNTHAIISTLRTLLSD